LGCRSQSGVVVAKEGGDVKTAMVSGFLLISQKELVQLLPSHLSISERRHQGEDRQMFLQQRTSRVQPCVVCGIDVSVCSSLDFSFR